ncbi:WGR domain-containing protein [Ancylobacter oerskovii]|uniref:WGR domain-containing protein n=1 Tax=Ancylobacter oerskovii TaxID=459519 RepID=A0ABW4Z4K7_9HYPH|nr:WGR domain-containing protein [Ancylobacter oerskovii]MBS7543048.1 WGR domain-containing protein [Ancylobacter oerskovii]
MLTQLYQLYVERTDASKNMARFYAMSIEPTLFGQTCLIWLWGRIGARGQIIQHSFDREDEAVALFLDLLCRKRKKGYRPKWPGRAMTSRHSPSLPLQVDACTKM